MRDSIRRLARVAISHPDRTPPGQITSIGKPLLDESLAQRDAHCRRTAGCIEFAEYVADVEVNGRTRQHELVGNLCVAQPLDHERKHFAFSVRESFTVHRLTPGLA